MLTPRSRGQLDSGMAMSGFLTSGGVDAAFSVRRAVTVASVSATILRIVRAI